MSAPPLVVQYLYLHAPGDTYTYPSARAGGGSDARRLAARYLECAAVQAASLRFAGVACEPVLVTNLADPAAALDDHGRRVLDAIDRLGVRRLTAPYDHAPGPEVEMFYSSRYVFDAIGAVTSADDPQRAVWLVDVDCVWRDPARAFAATPEDDAIACVTIGYPPDWDVSGHTRASIGALANSAEPPPWIGGELLAGRAGALRELVATCEALDAAAPSGARLPTEEALLTYAGALGQIRFTDRSDLAGRIWTGPRHGAANPPDPKALALWHLPSEKGLSFRRAARALTRDRTTRLRADLADAGRAAHRFNLDNSTATRVRNDTWLAAQKLRSAIIERR
ncbi:hypothetical protein [Baekduia sp. Peel2402]|uniref:hypothetical protein n=1 Tax=Baekduia sp. Peel2402 TaxID=3458296 RepID=UPI00403E8164